MKSGIKTAICYVRNALTGLVEAFTVVAAGVIPKRRRIPPSHGRHVRGRVPIKCRRKGRAPCVESIPYESRLERSVIWWLSDFPGFQGVTAQPLRVAGYLNGVRHEYTPDLLVEFDPVPEELVRLGFGQFTFVEVKPAKFASRTEVQLKLCMLELNTGLPSVLLHENHISMPGTSTGGHHHVH